MSNYDRSHFAHEPSLSRHPIARDSLAAEAMFVVPSPWGRLESVPTLSKFTTASSNSGISSRDSPPASRRVSFHEENLRLPPSRRNMTAGSLLAAVRSSCLQTFRRPQLLVAAFPLKVRPSWVSQKSLRVPLTVSRAVRQPQRSKAFVLFCSLCKASVAAVSLSFCWVTPSVCGWRFGISPTIYCSSQRRHTLYRLPLARSLTTRLQDGGTMEVFLVGLVFFFSRFLNTFFFCLYFCSYCCCFQFLFFLKVEW